MPVRAARTILTLYTLQAALLDGLLPPRCASCHRPGFRWCPACQAAAPGLQPPLCHTCGEPRLQADRHACRACRAHPPAFDQAAAWGTYGGTLQAAIQQFKFRRNTGLALVFAALLAETVQARGWPVDFILPIPLGAARRRERGYNQAALLARPLAAHLGCRYDGRTLQRRRETRPQVGLSRAERRANVAGAFSARAGQLTGRTLLVVDDVMTSGATLDAAAQALRAAGAAAVYALTIGRAH